MTNTTPFYCINLDRAEDRRSHFLKQVEHIGESFDIIRFPAIDGNSYTFSDKETNMFANYKNNWFGQYEGLTKRIMGNQLSHYYILCEVVKNNNAFAIVVQDDVLFRAGFERHLTEVMQHAPPDAEIISLGHHKVACGTHFEPWDLNDPTKDNDHSKMQVTPKVCILREGISPASLAYIVTLKGAQNLVAHFDKQGFKLETDHNFNLYLQAKNIFYASTPVLCTGNHHFKSSIFP